MSKHTPTTARERVARALLEHRQSLGESQDGRTAWDDLPKDWQDEWLAAADVAIAAHDTEVIAQRPGVDAEALIAKIADEVEYRTRRPPGVHLPAHVLIPPSETETHMTEHLTTVTIENADEARDHLLVCVPRGPSLHPDVSHEDRRRRWNGWNMVRAAAVDANGSAILLEGMFHAAGGIGWTSTPDRLLSHDHAQAWRGITFPLEALPARLDVLHPEFTPDAL